MNPFKMLLDSRLATLVFLVGMTFFGIIENASALMTLYPPNHPNATVQMNGDRCSVNGQAGAVVIMSNGAEGCAISSIVVYDYGTVEKDELESVRTR